MSSFSAPTSTLRSTTYTALVIALYLSSADVSARRRDCDCDNLEQVEEQIVQQQYLHQLFSQWADYLPASLLTAEDVRQRANALFNLTFYGVNSEVPQSVGSGAGATAGTEVEAEGCPLVRYLYDKKGRPVLRQTEESRKKHQVPPDLEHAWVRITEAQYPSHECAALVNFVLAHERLHRETCRSADTPKAKWKEPKFWAENDRDAYQEGLKVLYAERDKLKQCRDEPPPDGRWHGSLEFAYVFNDYNSQTVEKGKDKVYLNGQGERESGTRKSVRARAFIDAPAAGGTVKVTYQASRQESWFSKGTFVMPAECGSFRKTVFKLNNGTETRNDATLSGTADALIQIDGGVLRISYRVPNMPEGTYTRHEWNQPEGYCNEVNNKQTDTSDGRIETARGISVSMRVDIDPKHPNDIQVIQIEPADDGKGQYYRRLRLHRVPVE
jgi:hypothetical protein